MGLCLAVVLLTSGVVATSAIAALPEWGKCVKVEQHGKYRDPGCTEPAESRGEAHWVWRHAAGNTEVIENEAGGSVFEGVSGEREIECTHLVNKLWIPEGNPKSVTHVHLLFTGCEEIEEGKAIASCQNGETAGEIRSQELRGTLGYISGGGSTNPVVGLSLMPSPGQKSIAEFECSAPGQQHVVLGRPGGGGGDSVIATIAEIDKMVSSWELKYSESKPGIQNPTKFEGQSEDILETSFGGRGGPFEQFGLTYTAPYSSGAVQREIRAYVK
jgi:hypothetical protein